MASVLFTISVLLYTPLVIYVPALALSYGKNIMAIFCYREFCHFSKIRSNGAFFLN
jgi:hypothetical protein